MKTQVVKTNATPTTKSTTKLKVGLPVQTGARAGFVGQLPHIPK